MQNKDETKKESLGKIDYVIKTMDSDLKNEGFSNSSFDLSDHKKPEIKKIIKPKKIEKAPLKKSPANPFFKDIGSPNKQDIPTKTNKDKPVIPLSPNKKPLPLKANLLIPNKPSKKKTVINNGLLIVLFLIALSVAGASFYFFYFAKKTPPAKVLLDPITPTIKKEDLPQKLADSKPLFLLTAEQSLTSLLLEKKDTLSSGQGTYYQINRDERVLSSSEILSLLEIQFPEEISNKFKRSWFFLYSQENILKVNLVLEIKEESFSTIENFINSNEYQLPALIKPLFIDESFILKDEQISFQESGLDSDIRYYNFNEGSGDKAVDWGIVDNEYFILSTSKNSALKLIEDLKID